MNKCVVCSKEYESKRATSRYCGSACRKLAFQNKHGKVSVPANFGQPDCQCWMCRNNRANGNRHLINHGEHKRYYQLKKNEFNRVALPGDPDYTGIAQGADRTPTTPLV